MLAEFISTFDSETQIQMRKYMQSLRNWTVITINQVSTNIQTTL